MSERQNDHVSVVRKTNLKNSFLARRPTEVLWTWISFHVITNFKLTELLFKKGEKMEGLLTKVGFLRRTFDANAFGRWFNQKVSDKIWAALSWVHESNKCHKKCSLTTLKRRNCFWPSKNYKRPHENNKYRQDQSTAFKQENHIRNVESRAIYPWTLKH